MSYIQKKTYSFFLDYCILILALGITIVSCEKEPVLGENEFRDSRDRLIYRTVEIGNQIWMAQNLSYLPQVDTFNVESTTIPLYYIFDYAEPKLSIAKQTTNYFSFGVLYNWPAAIEACPEGWHLPSDQEWQQLEKFMGMSQENANAYGYRGSGDVGKNLKSKTNWYEDGNGMDSHGFDAKPGGRRAAVSGQFLKLGTQALFWSSTQDTTSMAILRYVEGDKNGISRSQSSHRNGVSVRCVKNSKEP